MRATRGARATTAAIVLVGLVFAIGIGGAQAGNADAEARKHARKANQLADANKCWSAIPEYDKALRVLKDATLLFNRGECYRKTGQPDKAIADYRRFLVELPAAPNRVQVEAQIAALQKVAAVAPPVRPASADASPPAGVTVSPSPSLRLPPKAKHALPDTPMPADKPKERDREVAARAPRELDTEPPSEMPAAPVRSVTPPPAPPQPAPGPVALAEPPPQPGLLDQGTALRPVDAGTEQKSGGHVWIWVALGVLVAGGAAAGAYVLLNPAKTDTSGGALGNYRF